MIALKRRVVRRGPSLWPGLTSAEGLPGECLHLEELQVVTVAVLSAVPAEKYRNQAGANLLSLGVEPGDSNP